MHGASVRKTSQLNGTPNCWLLLNIYTSSICNHKKCMYRISRYLAHIFQYTLAKLLLLPQISHRSSKALEMSVFLLHLYFLVAKIYGAKSWLSNFDQSLKGRCMTSSWKWKLDPDSHEQSKCYVAPLSVDVYRWIPPVAWFVWADWISRAETNFLQSLSSFGPGNKNNTNGTNTIMFGVLTILTRHTGKSLEFTMGQQIPSKLQFHCSSRVALFHSGYKSWSCYHCCH